MQIHRAQEGEIVLDLGVFLSGGRKFWWSDEVDEMMAALREHMPEHIASIITEVSARAHPKYQVLHIALKTDIPEGEFRTQAKQVIATYKAKQRSKRPRRHQVAS